MRILTALLFLAASQASASALYKCEGPAKDAISIQSDPCAKGAKQVWMRDGTPELPQTNEQLRASQAKQRKDEEDAKALSRTAGTDRKASNTVNYNSSNAETAKQRCSSAKQQAQVIRDRDWRQLTIARLRQLDAWVEAECKAK